MGEILLHLDLIRRAKIRLADYKLWRVPGAKSGRFIQVIKRDGDRYVPAKVAEIASTSTQSSSIDMDIFIQLQATENNNNDNKLT